ncbi:MFS transporter [Rhodococcoides fascians]|uniref:MFS transporter n=1 Tax=Rhodococcoides fascians TaxID=1828 RepID=UPI0005603530|nr:MFS transporter [Rhodococcus fascians]
MQRASVLTGTLIAVFTPAALIVGGLLLEAGASWQAPFFIVAVGYSALLVMTLLTTETPVQQRTRARLDVIGGLVLGLWLGLILMGLSQGNNWGWTSSSVIGLLVAGAVVLVLWVIQQRNTTQALIDFTGMDRRQTLSGYLAYVGMCMVAPRVYILIPAFAQSPSILGYGFGSSVLESSLFLMPMILGSLVAGAVTKRMLVAFGPRLPLVLGGLIVVIGFVFFILLHSDPWMVYVSVALFGLGVVMTLNVALALVSAAGRQDNMSITIGIQLSFAAPFAALGTAIILIVMDSEHVPQTVAPAESTYTTNFIILIAIACVALIVNGLVVAPKRVRDNSEIPVPNVVQPLPDAGTIPRSHGMGH